MNDYSRVQLFRQSKRAEATGVKNGFASGAFGAGSIAVAECFDGTAPKLACAAMAGIAIYSALKSVRAGQVDASLRGAVGTEILLTPPSINPDAE